MGHCGKKRLVEIPESLDKPQPQGIHLEKMMKRILHVAEATEARTKVWLRQDFLLRVWERTLAAFRRVSIKYDLTNNINPQGWRHAFASRLFA